jgi:hypothetical protein
MAPVFSPFWPKTSMSSVTGIEISAAVMLEIEIVGRVWGGGGTATEGVRPP